MTEPNTTSVREDDLHAFVDGALSAERAAAVAVWLEDHPAEAEQVRAWREQNAAIQSLHADMKDAPLPERLKPRVLLSGRRVTWTRLAASLALVVAGGFLGWFANGWYADYHMTEANMVARAVSAHRMYSREVRHPVEVVADEEKHLVRWLSKRLDHRLTVPDLSAAGYRLMGGRLLPAGGRAAAQFMFEDTAGKRLTLYVTRNPRPGETAFRFARDGAVGAFYWLDGDVSYALIGEASREVLLKVSHSVYDQINR